MPAKAHKRDVTIDDEAVALAHAYGFVEPAYSLLRGFKAMGVSRSYGWELVKRGELEVVHLSPRKVIILGTTMAAYIHGKRQNSKTTS
jgi:hypothetical protein